MDLMTLAGAIVVLLQWIFGHDFNPGNNPTPPRPDEYNTPVLVDPNTGTRSPTFDPRAPI
jgi:hypothetical protein